MRYGPKLAVIKSLKSIKGTYGLTVLFSDYPDRIIAARNSSPLVIGVGHNERLIASDPSAILGRTKNVIYMNDGEVAVLTKNSVQLFNVPKFKYLNILKRKEELEWGLDDSQKGGYSHFMLKEIFEQPESILNSFRGRLIKKGGNIKLGGLESIQERLKSINRLIITGCGTAYLAGSIGKLMIEELSGIPCEAELASELRYRNSFPNDQNLAMVAISQSGETADTLAALRRFKENNVLTLGIVNAVSSTIARETNTGVYNHAGLEIGVASTKAFTSQLVILALLALFLGQQRDLSRFRSKKITEELLKIPQFCCHVLIHNSKRIKVIAEKYKGFNNFLYIGRKYNFPMALEGA